MLLSDDEIERRLGGAGGLEPRRRRDRPRVRPRRLRRLGRASPARSSDPAEELGHHPDLEISWATVTVRISTHSEGGLTAADFELAARIDALA